jgi:hypothetical protein
MAGKNICNALLLLYARLSETLSQEIHISYILIGLFHLEQLNLTME